MLVSGVKLQANSNLAKRVSPTKKPNVQKNRPDNSILS